MKKSHFSTAVLLLAFVVSGVLAGCSAPVSHMYTHVSADDASKLWLIQAEPTTGKYPIVIECCDNCGKNGAPRCWEAAFN